MGDLNWSGFSEASMNLFNSVPVPVPVSVSVPVSVCVPVCVAVVVICGGDRSQPTPPAATNNTPVVEPRPGRRRYSRISSKYPWICGQACAMSINLTSRWCHRSTKSASSE